MPDKLEGRTIGDFRLETLIGRGAAGRVYRAIQLSLNRPVAVKVLEEGLFTLPELTKRFLREGEIVARLEHPHIVPVYAAGHEGPLHFFAMRLVEGPSLAARLASEIPLGEGLRYLSHVASALAYAHGQGLLHRDVKPANILLSHGSALLTDFGLARILEDSTITASHAIVGTPMYLSPEQARRERATPRSDLYALGIVLYELAVGRHPFAPAQSPGPSREELLARVAEGAYEPPREIRPDLPGPVEEAIRKALAARPEDRFASGTEMQLAFERLLGLPDLAAPPPPVVASDPLPEPDVESAPPTKKIDGQSFGKFSLRRKLGHGGMGIVYEAIQTDLGRVVALKVLLNQDSAEEEDVVRFQREARAAARLRHPNIVPIHEIGEVDGKHYFTMDFIAGEDLDDYAARENPGTKRAVEIARDVARAIAHAHAESIIHRDLKPANILVERGTGKVWVTDFGLARDLKSQQTRLTAPKAFMGTPAYASPEQAEGNPVLQSDVYALGAVLYHLLTGGPPHAGATPLDVLMSAMQREPIRPRLLNPKVHADAETICLKAMERDVARRYPSAAAFADDCDRFLAGEPILARPAGTFRRVARRMFRHRAVLLAVAVTATLALAGAGGWRIVSWKRTEREISDLRAKGATAHQSRMWTEAARYYRMILDRRPDDAEAGARTAELEARLRKIADLQLQIQNMAQASVREGLWTELIELDPVNAGAWAQRGICRLQITRKELPGALSDFEEALRLDAGEPAAHGGLAVYYFQVAKDLGKGRYHLDQAAKRASPDDWLFVVTLATRTRLDGRPEEALRLLAKLPGGLRNFFVEMERGKAHLALRQYVEALRSFTFAHELNPKVVDPLIDRGIVLLKIGMPGKALPDGKAACALDATCADAWVVVGRACMALDRFSEAREALIEALKFEPENGRILTIHAKCLVHLGEQNQALEILNRVIERDGTLAVAFAARGWLFIALNRYEDAERDLRRATTLDGDEVESWVNLGVALRFQRKFREALAYFEQACSVDPKDFTAAYNRALTLADLREFAQAREAYKVATALDRDGTAFFGYGYMLLGLGDLAEAEANLSCAIAKDFFRAFLSRGSARIEQLDLPGAIEDFEKTLEKDGDAKRRNSAAGNLERMRPLALRALDPWKGCAPGSSFVLRFESTREDRVVRKNLTYVLEKAEGGAYVHRCRVRSTVAEWTDGPSTVRIAASHGTDVSVVGEETLDGPKGPIRCTHLRNASGADVWLSPEVPGGLVRAEYRFNGGTAVFQLLEYDRK